VGIDLASSNYAHAKINERVLLYDGKTIPFTDDYFDFVFSSNVLEHIQDYAGFQQEIRRVLKSDGIAIHILPTHYWKFWTLISHYPALFKIIYQKIFSCKDISTTLAPNSAKKSIKKLAINTLFPERHGEFGNRFTEYYYFMPKTWIKKFIGSGWKIIKVQPGGILYGGYNLLASSLNFNIRKKISRYLGSACFIFILQK
jgi:SAM-dependent methyltransferase